MAGLFGVGGPLGPVAPGLSGAVNPLAILGAGMYQNNPLGAYQTMGNLQQAGMQLQQQQLQQQQLMAHRQAELEMQRRQAEQQRRKREAEVKAAKLAIPSLMNLYAPDASEEQIRGMRESLEAQAEAYPQQVSKAAMGAMEPAAPTSLQKNIEWAMSLPEGDPRKAAALESMTKPGTSVTVEGPGRFGSIPAGYAAIPDETSETGYRLAPLPGGPAGRVSPEQAGKKAGLVVATETAQKVKDAFVSPQGDVDRALVATFQANLPFTQGRLVRSQMEDALQTKLRAETGAAAPAHEVENLMRRYSPSSFDTDEQIVDKFERLQRFLDVALEESDPTLFKKLKEQAKNKPPPPGFIE